MLYLIINNLCPSALYVAVQEVSANDDIHSHTYPILLWSLFHSYAYFFTTLNRERKS
jgi:hypothetical protein